MDIWGIVFGSDGTFEDGAEVATAAAEDETVGAVVAPVTLTVVLGLIDIWGMVFGSDGTLDDGAADADVAAADDGVITSTKGMVTKIVVVEENDSARLVLDNGSTVMKRVVVLVVSVVASGDVDASVTVTVTDSVAVTVTAASVTVTAWHVTVISCSPGAVASALAELAVVAVAGASSTFSLSFSETVPSSKMNVCSSFPSSQSAISTLFPLTVRQEAA